MEVETEAETTKLVSTTTVSTTTVSTTTVSTTALGYPNVAREIRSNGEVILATTKTDGVLTVEYEQARRDGVYPLYKGVCAHFLRCSPVRLKFWRKIAQLGNCGYNCDRHAGRAEGKGWWKVGGKGCLIAKNAI